MQKLVPFFQNLLILSLIAIAAAFMLNAARGDSAIFDETAHIVAGYTYVRHLDYRFNPEHPPLVKILAGLPLLFQQLNFSTDQGYWEGLNEQWWAGNEFLYKSGNNADRVIFWARVGPILITLALIIFVYFWSRELIGRWWAFLPTFLVAFSPNILAHGHYVTTDIGAAFSMMLAIYFFLKFLFNNSNKNLVYAGLALGFAQAVKFSSILLIPYFFIIALVFFFIKDGVPFYKYLFNTFLIIVIGYAVIVNPLYLLTTWNYPLAKQIVDTQSIIQNFKIGALADLNIWMAGNKFLRPIAEYLLGVLMVLQRSAGGNNAYLLGELSSHGWWYYFPLVYLMKEPLPALLVNGIAFLISLLGIFASFKLTAKRIWKNLTEYLTIHFVEFSMIVFVILYWASSITSPLNIGVRHIIPTLPFIYILSSGVLRRWFLARPRLITLTTQERFESLINEIFNIWVKTLILGFLVIWLVVETSLSAPNFLSYFNEFFGWRQNGFYYVTDSNFDWGQDLKRLQSWVKINLEPDEKIAVDYFGGGDVKYYLGDNAEPWWSSRGNPKDVGITWLAISANTLQGALAKPVEGFYKNPADEYRWLENPYGFADRAGTAIFIYKL